LRAVLSTDLQLRAVLSTDLQLGAIAKGYFPVAATGGAHFADARHVDGVAAVYALEHGGVEPPD